MPEDARDVLRIAQRRLAGIDGVVWTKEENFHLTLAFLGEIDADGLRSSRERLAHVAFEPATIRIEGLSAFPSASRARVLWAGIAGGGRWLRDLASALQPSCDANEAEPFVPHVTIGRAHRSRDALDVASAIEGVSGSVHSKPFVAAPVVLYESVRTEQGSRYLEIARRG
jgi:2'-5' RNA ligase